MGCSFYRRERNYLSATDAWREAAVGDPPHICIRTASFECSVSKQMVVKTDQPDDRHPQTKTRSPFRKSAARRRRTGRLMDGGGSAGSCIRPPPDHHGGLQTRIVITTLAIRVGEW